MVREEQRKSALPYLGDNPTQGSAIGGPRVLNMAQEFPLLTAILGAKRIKNLCYRHCIFKIYLYQILKNNYVGRLFSVIIHRLTYLHIGSFY